MRKSKISATGQGYIGEVPRASGAVEKPSPEPEEEKK